MNKLKGWFGEKKTAVNLWFWLDHDVYTKYHDVILLGETGTTQIDHILVSKFGVFIIETKNDKGWIFGSVKDEKWIQQLFKRRSSFQNPLRQTFRQKKELANFLRIDEEKIKVVIYFNGDCKFKSAFPTNVITGNLSSYIKSHKDLVLDGEKVKRIAKQMDYWIENSNISSKQHRENLHYRHNQSTVCPKCGKSLTRRTANKGKSKGSQFLGCSGFPKCRYTRLL